jgi:hypothetical protein
MQMVSLKGSLQEKFSTGISPTSAKYSWERLGILKYTRYNQYIVGLSCVRVP